MNTNHINTFIINVQLIDPIKDILSKLEKGEFRDVDIKWLDGKLEHFTTLAAKTLFIPVPTHILRGETFTIMNEYVKNRYFTYFNTLLSHFSTYSN